MCFGFRLRVPKNREDVEPPVFFDLRFGHPKFDNPQIPRKSFRIRSPDPPLSPQNPFLLESSQLALWLEPLVQFSMLVLLVLLLLGLESLHCRFPI